MQIQNVEENSNMIHTICLAKFSGNMARRGFPYNDDRKTGINLK